MEQTNDKELELYFEQLKEKLPHLYDSIMQIQKDMVVTGNISVENIEKLCAINEELERM